MNVILTKRLRNYGAIVFRERPLIKKRSGYIVIANFMDRLIAIPETEMFLLLKQGGLLELKLLISEANEVLENQFNGPETTYQTGTR